MNPGRVAILYHLRDRCPRCGSADIHRRALKRLRSGDTLRYPKCRVCGCTDFKIIETDDPGKVQISLRGKPTPIVGPCARDRIEA